MRLSHFLKKNKNKRNQNLKSEYNRVKGLTNIAQVLKTVTI